MRKVRFLFDFDLFSLLGSERMIILSKVNLVDERIDLDEIKNLVDGEVDFLVDEGIDLNEIKNSIGKDSIVVGEDNEDGFSKLLGRLQWKHEWIQQVFIQLILFISINRIIQPPSPTFVKPSLTN